MEGEGAMLADWVNAVAQLGFPIVVAGYLLYYQGKQIDRFRGTLNLRLSELRIGLYLILQKLDALEEYEKAVKEYRDSVRDDKGKDKDDV